MPPIRLLFVAPCVAALICGAGAALAAKRDGRHAGHIPRVSTATYTRPVRAQAQMLHMVGAHGGHYASAHQHGPMRGS